jgi:NAD(P)-dependent dehydrogenase (short-subunit alcohol dehydrogenase family)
MSNRVAVVTGAGQGIGRGIALRLAKDGHDVVVNDIPANASKLDEVVSGIQGHGRRAIAVTGDASVESDVDSLVTAAVNQLGGLDVVSQFPGRGWSIIIYLLIVHFLAIVCRQCRHQPSPTFA